MPGTKSIGDHSPAGSGQHRGENPALEKRAAFDPQELLSRLWQQNLPIMRERVASLEQAAQEALAGVLSPARRTGASDLAHKLAGSLGMFGYPAGTEISREMENLLESKEEFDPAQFALLAQRLRSVLPL